MRRPSTLTAVAVSAVALTTTLWRHPPEQRTPEAHTDRACTSVAKIGYLPSPEAQPDADVAGVSVTAERGCARRLFHVSLDGTDGGVLGTATGRLTRTGRAAVLFVGGPVPASDVVGVLVTIEAKGGIR
jgi:hypothetical protein